MQKKNESRPRKRRGIRLLHDWHRYLGVSIALFVIYLSITGLLLNHSDSLQLDRQPVTSPEVLSIYGIQNPKQLTGYAVKANWISLWNQQLYFDESPVAHSDFTLKGAVALTDYLVVATLEEVILVTYDGQLIERLIAPSEKLGDIARIGLDGQGFVTIGTSQGVFTADADLIAWHPAASSDIHWSKPGVLPDGLYRQIVNASHSIHLERLLLDMHSGRIAGAVGVVIVDLVAIILMLLAISGVYMWYTRLRRGNKQS